MNKRQTTKHSTEDKFQGEMLDKYSLIFEVGCQSTRVCLAFCYLNKWLSKLHAPENENSCNLQMHLFGNPLLLRTIYSCTFMYNPMFLKKTLQDRLNILCHYQSEGFGC